MPEGDHTDLLNELRAALEDCSGAAIAVGVSGGADSMALLWGLAQVVGPDRVLALTVDHGLRPEAAGEAEIVAGWCRTQGIAHRTLQWNGRKPSSGLQAAAREARYYLLASACNEAGISRLAVAHHADDQAETVFARLARGAGPDGLSGMAPSRLIAAGPGEPVTLLRPLLGLRRAGLQRIANSLGLPVAHDPSNDDPGFERIRRRAFLAAAGVQDFLPVEGLLRSQLAANTANVALQDQLADDFRYSGGWFCQSGAIFFRKDRLAALPSGRRARLMARAVEAAGTGGYPVSHEALEADTLPASLTLGGALLTGIGEEIAIMREPAALLGRSDGAGGIAPVPATPGKPVLWDRRFVVEPPVNATGMMLAPTGLAGAGPVTKQQLASTMPGLWKDGVLISAPAYTKTMLSQASATWNRALSGLHVRVLTEERFFRRVIRFTVPAEAKENRI